METYMELNLTIKIKWTSHSINAIIVRDSLVSMAECNWLYDYYQGGTLREVKTITVHNLDNNIIPVYKVAIIF